MQSPAKGTKMNILVLAVMIPWFTTAPAEKLSDAQKKELRQFVGLWEYKEVIRDGKARDPKWLEDLTIEFAENGCFMIKHKNNVVGLGRITIDPSKSPKEVDLTYSERGEFDGKLRGVTESEGIYEIDKNSLRFCFNTEGNKSGRPTSFASKPTEQRVLESLQLYRGKRP
jgi:uncharacterized protein (TIGR03067 family)